MKSFELASTRNNSDDMQRKSGTSIFRVGIYTRLSLDDAHNRNKKKSGAPPDESMSIENQREYLMTYAEKMGWHVEKTYTDDGYSGSNFNRPGFIEMMNDIETGLINLILVKDLSRFGRNYLEVGRYTDSILPMLNCRFVAVSDGIDSSFDCDNMLHIRNLYNDYYLKDVSKKIKVVHRAMAQQGKRISGRPPYGYSVDPENRHRFVIDDYAANVVRRIFDLRKQNYGYARIAGVLNADEILSPREYEYHKKGKEYPYPMRSVWLTKSVKSILRNESYIGNRVQLKSSTLSYKLSTIIQRPSEEWIRVENVHDPIIDIETWRSVQDINARKSAGQNAAAPRPRLFRGLLRCPDCGSSFTVSSSINYQCIRYQQTASVKCSSHLISESALKKILLEDVKAFAAEIKLNKDSVIHLLTDKLNSSKQDFSMDELALVVSRIAKLEQTQVQIYEEMITGVISKQAGSKLLQNYEVQKNDLSNRQRELLERKTLFDQRVQNVSQWVGLIERYSGIEDIDRDFLVELIEKIEIGKLEYVGGVKQQNVKIFYKLVGSLG